MCKSLHTVTSNLWDNILQIAFDDIHAIKQPMKTVISTGYKILLYFHKGTHCVNRSLNNDPNICTNGRLLNNTPWSWQQPSAHLANQTALLLCILHILTPLWQWSLLAFLNHNSMAFITPTLKHTYIGRAPTPSDNSHWSLLQTQLDHSLKCTEMWFVNFSAIPAPLRLAFSFLPICYT